jgi:Tfp pilus assembly protein PilN
VLFCVVISAIGGAFTVTERTMREIEDQYAKVQDQYTNAAKRIEQVQQMQDKQRKMAQQAELTAGLLEKVPRSFVLAELTNGIPEGISLLDFRLDSVVQSGPPPKAKTAFEIRQQQLQAQSGILNIPTPQARQYDVTMRINGIATTDDLVGDFIGSLSKSQMFNDVNLLFTEEFKVGEDKDVKVRKFQIEMKLDPRAQVDVAAAKAMNEKSAAMPLDR